MPDQIVAFRGGDLLEREDPQTRFPEDARHWIAIYREMISFNQGLLERAREVLSRSSQRQQGGGLARDVGVLADQLSRYQERLEFWYGRQWALEGFLLDRDSRTVTYRDRSVALTGREFQLLETLAHRAPAYMRAQQLLVEAWRDSRLPEETLRTYIVRLRSKLAELGAGIEIVNRPRRGYALTFERPGAAVSRL
jgi:DNA-binding response OmpR family regulator